MTDEHQSVEQLFAEARALPPDQRSCFLDRACRGAPMLRKFVEELIDADGIPESFLNFPALPEQNGQSPSPEQAQMLSQDHPPRFGVGQIIADRFKVVRFIARGGMGEVYEVQDRFLQGTPVALKIIRPHIAADPSASRRFEQEVLLARRVNHRHLCPIYDIFHCDDPLPPFLFLTMKLLAGESLQSRLKHPAGIPLQEGLQICRQLIDGIGAIHSVGIVHRDIKPSNVMLEPSGSEICVTIMDFGLARLTETDVTVSKIGMVAGTPGYLAPELMRGASPSAASDLYALGVVLHQVLTGVRPKASRTGDAVTVSPELATSKAPAGLVHALTDFLAADPERRCTAFERIADQANASAEHPALPLLTRRRFAFSGAAALGCLGAASLWKWREIDDYLHPLPKKRFVALLNWPPPTDAKVTPILLGLIDTMVNALSRAEAYDHDFYVACQTSLTEMKTPAQVTDVCESLGTNLILATSGSMAPAGISLSLQVLAAGSGKLLRSKTLHVPTSEKFALPELVTHAAARLLNISAPASGTINQAGTDNPNALAAFQAAEAQMKEPNNSGLDGAIEKFKQAVELDSHFANAHARLATAYVRKYGERYDGAFSELARANAQTAISLDPICIEAHAALAVIWKNSGEYSLALREIALALAPDPGNSRNIIYQAQIYWALNQWQHSEETLKRVLRARPNFWLAYHELGNTYSYQGKYRLALQSFQAASASAPRNALAIANTAHMFFLLGDLDRADAAISRSISLSPLSLAFEIRSDIMRAHGRYLESFQAATKASEMSPEDSTPWLRQADALERLTNHKTDAAAAYRRALDAVAEDIKLDPKDRPSWILLALFEAKAGDHASAASSIRNADAPEPLDIYSLMHKVRVLELLGRRQDALSTLADCLNMGATATQIRSTNDLEKLTSDPRYLGPSRAEASKG